MPSAPLTPSTVEQNTTITEDIWRIYSTEQGNYERSLFCEAGIPLTAISELPAIACHHFNASDAADFFVSRYKVEESARDNVITAAKNILNFEFSVSSSVAKTFLTRCAELYLMMWTNMHEGHKQPSLPRCSSSNAALLDLASGPQFVNFFSELDPITTYYAVDRSFFAIECVRLKAEAEKLDNVIALQRDVMELTRADIPTSFIEVIRAKNIFSYVPNYLYSFQDHLSWLGNSGRFVFEEQASEKTANEVFNNDLIKRNFEHLIDNGWGFSYIFGDLSNPLSLNTVKLLKIREGTKVENQHKLESFYAELNSKYDFT